MRIAVWGSPNVFNNLEMLFLKLFADRLTSAKSPSGNGVADRKGFRDVAKSGFPRREMKSGFVGRERNVSALYCASQRHTISYICFQVMVDTEPDVVGESHQVLTNMLKIGQNGSYALRHA